MRKPKDIPGSGVPCKIDNGDLFGRRTATLPKIRRTGGRVTAPPFYPKCYTMLCFSAVKETILFLRTFSHGDTCSLNDGAPSVVVVVVA